MYRLQSICLSIMIYLLSSLTASSDTPFSQKLVKAALDRTKHTVRYDPKYVRLKYPGGDVPADTGVCSDVIIRSYRALGIDLQKRVHEDMKRNFRLYPKRWGLKRPDTNIDHRRVLNLEVFFKRFGQSLPVTQNPKNYKPGDIVTWNLKTKGSLPHIGIVTNSKAFFTGNPMIVHNIGFGPKHDDILSPIRLQGIFVMRRSETKRRSKIKDITPDYLIYSVTKCNREEGPLKFRKKETIKSH